MTDDDFEIVRGSGNIYADLGDPDADTKLMKAQLASEIIATLDRRKLTVREGEKLTGVTAADLSRIRNADLGRFTIDRLVRVLNALDRRVTLKVGKTLRSGRTAAA
ncbi:helix-turn-helix transcriptional regulator [Neorhizobium sp. JUb45]|uniref:helix-turn-helix domain-containing protein n=1 Tax=unclassified Neorhizobium TaxID=2629175 RepID=UPI00104D129B|nr:helix-turn-helix transcriptional regulator [Neorhizobium sp. JUb45]TCR04415.1 putative XRE-type DNA-binding protein [Neorhizobium sp. JUb45]